MSLFDDVSCFYCGSRNEKLGECTTCKKQLNAEIYFIGKTIHNFTIKTYKARGYYGLTFFATDPNNKPVAIKVISSAAYEKHRKNFSTEASIYSQIPEHNSIARYITSGSGAIEIKGIVYGYHYIISKWIEGVSLNTFFTGPNLSPAALYYLGHDILAGLEAFAEKDLWHNDLHENNILVEDLSRSQQRVLSRNLDKSFVMVDVGSAQLINRSLIKPTSDLNNLGKHLANIRLRILRSTERLSKNDQYFLALFDGFASRLCDESILRGFKNPTEAIEELERLWLYSRSNQPEDDKQKLDNPFGLINALEILSPSLVVSLYSDKLPYFRQIMSKDFHAVVITGPRGCGKTLALKLMNYDTILYGLKDPVNDFGSVQYIGLFISARSELSSFSLATRRPKWMLDERIVCLYFNILFTIQLLKFLYKLIEIGIESEQSISLCLKKIQNDFNLSTSEALLLNNELLSIILRIMDNDTLPITERNSTPHYMDSTIREISSALQSLSNKKIVLLVDDLSMPRVPKEFIQHLIPFLFNPSSSYLVRVSSHSYGMPSYDLSSERLTQNRDYVEINLGREYIAFSEKYEECRNAFDDIMRRRYSLASHNNYPGLENLLGIFDDMKKIGSTISGLSKEKKLNTLMYKGSHAFVTLCSGDISYSVDLLRLMSEKQNSTTRFTIRTQNRIIREYSRSQLFVLKDFPSAVVPSLFEVGQVFGEISHTLLKQKYSETLLIELELSDSIDDKVLVALQDLFASGLFIDGGYGITSKGVITKKLILRRIYTPAFPTTVSNRNTINMNRDMFLDFILNPRGFQRSFYAKNKLRPELTNGGLLLDA